MRVIIQPLSFEALTTRQDQFSFTLAGSLLELPLVDITVVADELAPSLWQTIHEFALILGATPHYELAISMSLVAFELALIHVSIG